MILLPSPKEVNVQCGEYIINFETKIIIDSSADLRVNKLAFDLKNAICKLTGLELCVIKGVPKENSIFLKGGNSGTEEYKLSINTSGVVLFSEGLRGLFYCLQTFKQILIQYQNTLPCLEINDRPDFDVRGYYLDISRGRVPTLESLKRMVDKLAYYKINQFQIYVEHTFAFENMSEMWTNASPITAEEILILDEYCVERSIELVPSFATLGHMYTFLGCNIYNHLAELEDCPKNSDKWGVRPLNSTLNAKSDEAFNHIIKMIDEVIPLFKSNKFNICCDEPEDIGKGRNKNEVDCDNEINLYVYYLNRLASYVKSKGKEVMFWSDVIIKHPKHISNISQELTCMNWCYSNDEAILKERKQHVKNIAEAGFGQYMCTSTRAEGKLLRNCAVSYENCLAMTKMGREFNAEGIMITDWGDWGHVSMLTGAITPIIVSACMSWNLDATPDFDKILRDISVLEFGDETATIAKIMSEMGEKQEIQRWDELCCWIYNITGKFEAQILGLRTEVVSGRDGKKLINAYNDFEKAGEKINKLKVYEDKTLDKNEFLIACRGEQLVIATCLALKKYYYNQDVTVPISPIKLANDWEHWLFAFQNRWRITCKESELYRINEVIIWICEFLRGLAC